MNMASAAADQKKAIIELRLLKMRNTQDAMPQRTNDYFAKAYAPALGRAGIGPVGFFANLIGPDSPSLLIVTQYPDIAAWDSATRKLASDNEFAKARDAYRAKGLGYFSMETTLLRGFDTVPGIELPPAPAEGKSPRIFEIRTYRSNNLGTLRRKIRMFDEGEIALFRKIGMRPVFFGETIAGRDMPNLTYMLAFDDLAAREKAWNTFITHPEWEKMRSQPGVSDAEIVSNISNWIVRPLPFSQIR